MATLRAANAGDLPNIERLLTASGLPTAGVAEILTARADDFVVTETIDDAGIRELVGVGGLEVCCETALLRSVAVRPEWRKHGVGHELVKRIVCMAEARGLRALYLLTLTAEHYFPRFGFTRIERGDVPAEIAETLEFKSACPASAIAMAKSLT
jgi:amino-acid N-acetyltransferase